MSILCGSSKNICTIESTFWPFAVSAIMKAQVSEILHEPTFLSICDKPSPPADQCQTCSKSQQSALIAFKPPQVGAACHYSITCLTLTNTHFCGGGTDLLLWFFLVRSIMAGVISILATFTDPQCLALSWVQKTFVE